MGKVRVEVIRVEHLSAAEVSAVLALTRAAGDADGAYPLSEHVTLHLRHGGDAPAVHLLAVARGPLDGEPGRGDPHGGPALGGPTPGGGAVGDGAVGDETLAGGMLVGYAHVDTTDAVEGASAELCVHPLYRRRGLGRALVVAAIQAAEEAAAVEHVAGRLRLWAHGDHPSANALALTLGFVRTRVLWQMRRSLYAPVPAPVLPEGVRLRPYRPGIDDDAWLQLNARAFADHPDQGRWTAADLRVRLGEDWFDPAGFLLAERAADASLVGFHWTKVHGTIRHATDDVGEGQDEHDHDPIGEVYVLGVDPSAQGLGLGTALTLAGLRYLRDRGLDQVMLYVEESNRSAIALYQTLGFARWSTDVMFRRPA